MYYLVIKDGQIIDKTQMQCTNADAINIEVSEAVYNNWERYIWDGEKIILDPDYEQKHAQKEYERVGELTMTALDFITFLRQSGLTLEQIKSYLDNNLELDMQLKYCQNVFCKVARSVMPITVGAITITAKMTEDAFKAKNGEIELLSDDEVPF